MKHCVSTCLGLIAGLGLCTASLHAFPVVTAVVETGGDNEPTDTILAKWTGVTWNTTIANEPTLNTPVGTAYTVPPFGEDVPCYVDRAHQWNGATVDLPLPAYLVGGEYIMSGNDNRDNAAYQLDITVSEAALVYMLIDNRLSDGNAADPPESGLPVEAWTGMAWIGANGFAPVLNGLNRFTDPNVPDEVGVDEGGDGAGPGGSIQNWSSVYSKQVPAGTFSIYQADNGGRNMYGVVIKPLPNSINNPPVLTNLVPANNTLFYDATGGLRFGATTVAPNRIDATNVHLTLNGTDVSAALTIGGTATSRTAAYNNLKANTAYQAVIVVSDQAGHSSTNRLNFDTFTAANALMVEAEDYNYDGGKTLSPPAPGGFANLTGTPGLDYFDQNLTAVTTQYRPTDYVGLAVSSDVARAAVPTDFVVSAVQSGEWLHFTRTLANGAYQLYLRAAGSAGQRVRLDRVSDPVAASPTRTPLGYFLLPGTASATPFLYVPLTDAAGQQVTLSLSGATTLRLTVESANLDLQLNYLLLMPTATTTQPAYLSVASPAPGALGVGPDAVVNLKIAHGSAAVAANTVKLTFNGADVTGTATVTGVSDGVIVSYDPPGLLATNSTFTVRVDFTETGGPARSNTWAFATATYLPVIPANYGTAPGTGQQRGVNFKVRKAPDWNVAGTAFTLANNSARAEQQLADLLIDPDTTLPFINEAGGLAGDGTATGDLVNFQQLGAVSGYFPGDQPFPNIDPGVFADPNNIAMETTTYLELAAGTYRFGVRSDDGFRLTAGPLFTAANLVLGAYEGGRGDGLPGGATEFDFVVAQAGLYPVRLIWYEGNGGAALEFYSVDRTTFKRTLINDPTSPNAIPGYRTRSVQVHLPVITLTNPTRDKAFPTGPTNLVATADASEVNGRIALVEFFLGGAKVGEATAPPYQTTLANLMPGRYTMSARATDTNGLSTATATLPFTVGASINVNFQAASAAEIPGYLPDYGDVYADRGNGYTYGWDLDNLANSRERNDARSPDKRYDTFNHLQKPQPAGSLWEIQVPNGRYHVFAVAGEASNIDSVYDLTVEGLTVVQGTPTDAVRWYEGMAAVTVTDGRLSVGNGPKAANNKVAFLEIYPLPAEVVKPVFTTVSRSGQTLTLTWTGGGKLQEATDLTGPWSDVAGNPQGTAAIQTSAPRKFYRVMVP